MQIVVFVLVRVLAVLEILFFKVDYVQNEKKLRTKESLSLRKQKQVIAASPFYKIFALVEITWPIEAFYTEDVWMKCSLVCIPFCSLFKSNIHLLKTGSLILLKRRQTSIKSYYVNVNKCNLSFISLYIGMNPRHSD